MLLNECCIHFSLEEDRILKGINCRFYNNDAKMKYVVVAYGWKAFDGFVNECISVTLDTE